MILTILLILAPRHFVALTAASTNPAIDGLFSPGRNNRNIRSDKGASSKQKVSFVEVGVDLSKGPSNPPSEPPIGGRLALFTRQWEVSTTDAWVRETILSGLTLEFHSTPPTVFLTCPVSRDRTKRTLVSSAIKHLSIKAIQRVSRDQYGQGFYSCLFLVRKSSGGWRAVLDLKALNQYIIYRWCKMHSLHTILDTIRPGDLLSSIDLTEAYLHVPILSAHRKYLHFHNLGGHYQYTALPFGLSSAPQVFTKIMAALVAHIQTLPIRIQFYLDDILIQPSSISNAHQDLSTTIHVLQRHGFSINWAKSHLTPSTSLQHLGAVIDMIASTVSLSLDCQTSLRTLAQRCVTDHSSTVLGLSRVLGKMVSTFGIVPWSHLHSRELQWFLLPHQKACYNTALIRVTLTPAVLASL